MNADLLKLFVFVAELASKVGPGLIVIGENLINAIQSRGDMTEEAKADLIARVKATRAAVAAYEPVAPKDQPAP